MTVDVDLLPRHTIRLGTEVFRINRSHQSPWYFDGSDNGRFNPSGSLGRGACYWAEEDLGAWIEVYRRRMLLTPEDVSDRSLSSVILLRSVEVVDLTEARGLKAGVTSALVSGDSYVESQALADRLQGTVAGVRWRLRHDLRGQLIGVALWGDEGTLARPTALYPTPTTRQVPSELIKRAGLIFGYEIRDTPS